VKRKAGPSSVTKIWLSFFGSSLRPSAEGDGIQDQRQARGDEAFERLIRRGEGERDVEQRTRSNAPQVPGMIGE